MPPFLADDRWSHAIGKQTVFVFLISVCHPERREACPTADRSRSFFERTARKNRGANATMGSRNEFGWLSTVNVTFSRQDTESLNEIPHRPKGLALSPRSSLGESSTPLRMTG